MQKDRKMKNLISFFQVISNRLMRKLLFDAYNQCGRIMWPYWKRQKKNKAAKDRATCLSNGQNLYYSLTLT